MRLPTPLVVHQQHSRRAVPPAPCCPRFRVLRVRLTVHVSSGRVRLTCSDSGPPSGKTRIPSRHQVGRVTTREARHRRRSSGELAFVLARCSPVRVACAPRRAPPGCCPPRLACCNRAVRRSWGARRVDDVRAPAAVRPVRDACGRAWGRDPVVDQQLAELLMWVPGFVLTLMGVALFTAWLAESERRERPAVSPP